MGSFCPETDFCPPPKTFVRRLCNSYWAEHLRVNHPVCYITLVSSTLFDLSNIRCSKKSVSTCWSVLTDFCHYLHLLLIDSFLSSLQVNWAFWKSYYSRLCFYWKGLLFQSFASGLISFEYTNVANEDCVKFCMKEKFQV